MTLWSKTWLFPPSDRFFFTDPDRLQRPLSKMPFIATLCVGCAAICLGIAQASLDTLIELGSSKIQVDPFPGLRDRPFVQAMVASTMAKLNAARRLLHETVESVWTVCMKETQVSDYHRASLWESGTHAARTAKSVVTTIYEAAGASALYIDCPIERAHRDIFAVMQHVIFAPMWLEAAGRVRFGLPVKNPLF